ARKVGDIKNVDRTLAEGRNMRRGDVEVQARKRVGEIVEKPRPVETGDFDHAVAVGPGVVDGNFRHDGKRSVALLRTAGDDFGQAHFAFQRLFYALGDSCGAAFLVLVVVEFARDRNRIEREPVGRGENLRVDDVAAGDGASPRNRREEPRMVL